MKTMVILSLYEETELIISNTFTAWNRNLQQSLSAGQM